MKSIKPGRGPSMMSGLMGIFVIAFGIFWTIVALNIAPFMAIFGVIFVIIALINVIYSFKNATSKNRYSDFDITDSSEESDPFNERFGEAISSTADNKQKGTKYCPYCGEKNEDDYNYCRYCGRKLPK